MLESKKTTSALVIFLIFSIIVFAIVLVINHNSEQNLENNTFTTDNSNSNTELNTDVTGTIKEITSYNYYFTAIDLINSFYLSVYDADYDAVYNKLNNNYINKNNITKSNINEYFRNDLGEYSFTYDEMYLITKDNMNYYFISGNLQLAELYGEVTSNENKTYIIATNNKNYVIMPVNYQEDLKSYAENYNLNNISLKLNDDNTFSFSKTNDKRIILAYIGYFNSLVYDNPEKAFSMLDNNTASIYGTYQNLYVQREIILNKLNSNYYATNISGKNFNRKYIIALYDNSQIIIKENKFMDFTISFN